MRSSKGIIVFKRNNKIFKRNNSLQKTEQAADGATVAGAGRQAPRRCTPRVTAARGGCCGCSWRPGPTCTWRTTATGRPGESFLLVMARLDLGRHTGVKRLTTRLGSSHVRFRRASSDWRGSDSPSPRFMQHRRLTQWTAVRAKMRLGLQCAPTSFGHYAYQWQAEMDKIIICWWF